ALCRRRATSSNPVVEKTCHAPSFSSRDSSTEGETAYVPLPSPCARLPVGNRASSATAVCVTSGPPPVHEKREPISRSPKPLFLAPPIVLCCHIGANAAI